MLLAWVLTSSLLLGADPGTVQGRVLSATTGEPLRKVNLTLRPTGRATTYNATTDSSGNFRFPSVDVGRYNLAGERNGFVRASAPAVIEITTGQNVTGIELKLMPQAVITGRITDEDGDPVRGASVQAMRYTYPNGRRQLGVVQANGTNDLGEFRITDLLPGRYYLAATAPKRNQGPAGGRGGRGAVPDTPDTDYVPTYFPQAVDVAGASAPEVAAGSELRGMDIRLAKARLFRIRGVVSGAPAMQPNPNGRGGRGGNVMLNLVQRNSTGPGQRGVMFDPATQTFEIRGVLPGSYYVMAQTGQPPNRMAARAPVDVGNADIDDLNIRLLPPVTVNGTITGSSQISAIRVGFIAESGPGGNTQAKTDGSFQIQLAPDRYAVNIMGVPEGFYVRSVKLAGREIPADGVVDFAAGTGPMEVALGSNAGDVAGTVQNSRGEPAGNVQVIAAPASGSLRRDLYKSGTTDANGTFTLKGLAPGEYQLFAWEEIEPNAWLDADYRKAFEGWSAKARVESSGTPSVMLNVIPRK